MTVSIEDLNWDTNETIDMIINDEGLLRDFECYDLDTLRDMIHVYSPQFDVNPEEVDVDAVFAYLRDEDDG